MRPNKLNILGKVYAVEYVSKPSDVDIHKRESLWGQIDSWTKTIRILDQNNGRTEEDIWHSIIHETLHGIGTDLKLVIGKAESHDELDILALAFTDFLIRNDLLKIDGKETS